MLAAASIAASSASNGNARMRIGPRSSKPPRTIAASRAGASFGYMKLPITLQSLPSISPTASGNGSDMLPMRTRRPPRRSAWRTDEGANGQRVAERAVEDLAHVAEDRRGLHFDDDSGGPRQRLRDVLQRKG